MSYDPITSLASLKSEIEGTWKNFDDVYATFSPKEWSRKFGKTWIYADQPFHLAYFDRSAGRYASLGTDVPGDEKIIFKTLRDVDVWNNTELGKRGPGHTVEQSLEEMRSAREYIRGILSKMTDSELDKRAWSPLLGGWVTVRLNLQGIVIHNAGEYIKLLLRLGRKEPALSPAAVHIRLKLMMSFLAMTCQPNAAKEKPFTQVWNFTGPGGGAWTFRVEDGKCAVSKGAAERADLTFTMTPESFHKMLLKITPPPLLMLTGQMKVKGFSKMGTFAKLFPEPKPDDVLFTSEQGMTID